MKDYTLYVCVSNINASHRKPRVEDLSVEKKRIVSLVMRSLTHPTSIYLVPTMCQTLS